MEQSGKYRLLETCLYMCLGDVYSLHCEFGVPNQCIQKNKLLTKSLTVTCISYCEVWINWVKVSGFSDSHKFGNVKNKRKFIVVLGLLNCG